MQPIPHAFSSIDEAGDFWDTHSLADYWGQTREVKNAKLDLARRHLRIDADLARKIHQIARRRGISTETLVNLWLQEKIS